MKRARLVLPLLGLLLLASGLVARALRGPGLALEPFPEAPRVHLPPVDVALGNATLGGVVLGADGRGVVEALVELVQDDEPVWTYTDARGRFVLRGLWPGPHALVVASRTHQLADFQTTAPDETLVLVLDRPFGPTQVLPPIERATLRGRVDPTLESAAVQGYEVALLPVAPLVEFGAPVERRAEITGNGSFAIDDLILGEYRVAVLPPWASGGAWPDLCAEASRAYSHAPSAARPELVIELAAGELVGVARDAEDEPLEGALVLAHRKGEPERLWPPLPTDAEGGFVLRDLPPGEYVLELRAGKAEVHLDARVEVGSVTSLDVPRLETRGARIP